MAHWQLRHPHVVRLLGVYEEPSGGLCMVLPYMSNQSADIFLRLHRDGGTFLRVVCVAVYVVHLSMRMARLFGFNSQIQGAISGVAYLHSRGAPMIHGDLHDVRTLLCSRTNRA